MYIAFKQKTQYSTSITNKICTTYHAVSARYAAKRECATNNHIHDQKTHNIDATAQLSNCARRSSNENNRFHIKLIYCTCGYLVSKISKRHVCISANAYNYIFLMMYLTVWDKRNLILEIGQQWHGEHVHRSRRRKYAVQTKPFWKNSWIENASKNRTNSREVHIAHKFG